jgi:O-antigen/teichoic acid export membrane protein
MAARLLSADARGLWLGLQLVLGYGQNLHMGAVYGMFRSVPMLTAQGNRPGAEAVKRTTFTFVIAMSLLGSVGLLVVLLNAPDAAHRRHFLLTGLLTFITLLKTYYVTVFKAESRFRDLSISAGIGSVTSVLTVGLIVLSQLDGLIWGMIIQAVGELAWLLQKEPRLRFGWDFRLLRDQLNVGVLTLVTTLGTLLLQSVDRTVMLSRLGTTATGQYYIGANIIVLVPTVAALPATVLTPRFFEVFGATSRGDSLVDLVERPTRTGAVVFAAGLGIGVLAMPPVVAQLAPGLLSGIPAAQVAALGGFAIVMIGFVTNVYYAMNKQSLQLVLIGMGAGVGFASAHIAVRIWPTITSAAAGGAAGIFAYYAGCTVLAHKLMTNSSRAGLNLFVAAMTPAAVAVALVALLDRLGGLYWPQVSVVRALVAELCFCGAFGPWVWRSLRTFRTGPVLR